MLFKEKAFPIITVLTGATLEYYSYMLFAVMISKPDFLDKFFMSGSASLNILKGSLFFLLCASCRPLGALIFGWIGDKYGRRQALFGSLILMAASCFVIAGLPTYQTVGVSAIVILFVARVSQIISASGETNGAPIFLIEHFGLTRAGLASGLAYFGTMSGSTLASLACSVFTGNSWRYAFLLGGLAGIVGMIIRLKVRESKEFTQSSKDEENTQMTQQNISSYLVVGIISACCSGGFYYAYMSIPAFWKSSLNFHQQSTISSVTTYMTFLYSISLLTVGLLSDYFSLFKVMKLGAILLLCSISTFLYSISFISSDVSYFNIITYACIFTSLGMFAGPSHSFMYRFFPPRCRYRAVSLSYSIATATIGAGTYPASMALYNSTKLPIMSGFWIIPIIIAAYISLVIAQRIWKKREADFINE